MCLGRLHQDEKKKCKKSSAVIEAFVIFDDTTRHELGWSIIYTIRRLKRETETAKS